MKGAPDRQLARKIYRDFALTYDRYNTRSEVLLGRLGIRPLRDRIISQLHLQQGDTVVDVGCGTGLSFSLLEECIGPRGRLIGVDLTPEMLAKARDRVTSCGWENVTLIRIHSCEECNRFDQCHGGCPAVAWHLKNDINGGDPECLERCVTSIADANKTAKAA